MRRFLPFLVALVLGAGSAVLVACGDSGTDDGIPQASADRLSADFEDVQQAVDDARCKDVGPQLRQLNERIDALPSSVDSRLRDRLREAQTRLASDLASDECNENLANEQPEEPTETVPEETVPEETVPQETVPEETVPQETVPEETVPVDPIDPTDPTNPDPGLPPTDDDTLPPDQGGGTSPDFQP